MDQYTACLARACLDFGDLDYLYTGNVPSDFKIPCLYIPPDDLVSSKSALNNYALKHSVYAKVFAKDREAAGEIMAAIVEGIAQVRYRLTVYDQDGKETGELLQIQPPDARVIDEGVAQITLVYSIKRRYPEPEFPKAKYYHINYH